MKEKPDVPPSAVAEAKIEARNMTESIRELCKNKNFALLVIQHAFNGGVFMTVGAVLSNLLDPFGLSP